MIGRRLARLWRDERATSDVEFILLVSCVVAPLCLILPWYIVHTNAQLFDRINIIVNLPFP